jgi:hypothetical protein
MTENRTTRATQGRIQSAAKRRAVRAALNWQAAYQLVQDPAERRNLREHLRSVIDSEGDDQ